MVQGQDGLVDAIDKMYADSDKICHKWWSLIADLVKQEVEYEKPDSK